MTARCQSVPPCPQLTKSLWLAAVMCGCLAIELPPLAAAVVAMDAASNPAYQAETGGAWKGANPTADENPAGLDDGGLGFKPWDFAGGYHYSQQSPYGRLNHFIDGVDFAGSAFNDLGTPAFALTNANVAFGGATSVAARAFVAPLAVGATISFKFDNPALAPLQGLDDAGVVIRLNSGGGPLGQTGVKERFAVFAASNFLNGQWATADSAGDQPLGASATETAHGAEFRFTLTGAESYRFELWPLSGGTPLATKSGSLSRPGTGAIDAVEIVMYGNGSGDGLAGGGSQPTGEREFYFNNLAITTAAVGGDYDGSGVVDGADFLHWQRSFGSTVDLAADGDGNGVVAGADLQIWKNALATPVVPVAATVPEPTALATTVAPLWLALRLKRRAKSGAYRGSY